ncbi:MAG TPA: cytochrome c oxidase subunit II [Longimicrobiales bacterium]|nr:cytochrome c oxidase subunit II [Longimicrobiales bacterium]
MAVAATVEKKRMLVTRAVARRTLCALPLMLTGCRGDTNFPQTTFHPVSEFGRILNGTFYITFWWTMIILVIVIALILYAVFRFRERPDTPQPKQIHGNTMVEILWTIVPAFIVVAIAVPTVQAIFETQRRPPEDALIVEVIGHQWWWEFNYPQYGVRTANTAWLPTGRPVSLAMRSADVIHSFWIPRIGGKRDVNPLPRRREGTAPKHDNYLLFTVDEPGHYLGQCAEYCGEAHAIMRMTVNAVTPAAFDDWVQRMTGTARDTSAAADSAAVPTPAQASFGQLPAPTGAGNPFRAPLADTLLAAAGERIFTSAVCTACHAVAGTSAAGTIGPDLTLFGTRPYIGAGAAGNTREQLEQWIRDPQSLKPGTLMPGTRRPGGGMPPTNLTDAEVRAVAAYLSSLK